MRRIIALTLGLMVLVAGSGAQSQVVPSAHAGLKNAKGEKVGDVQIRQFSTGVLIQVNLQGLVPGWHAMHIHETGVCQPPFVSAGEHFNPGGEQHGFDRDGSHAGDLPNISVAEDGTARAEIFNNRIALVTDQPTDINILNRALGAVRSAAGMETHNLFAGRGASVVIHAEADDYQSNPGGGASTRIACGVILRQN